MKTATWRTGNRGFSLLELLVVLLIMAGVAALVVPQFSTMTTLAGLRSNTRELASALRAARSDALARHREVALMVDVQNRTYGIAGASQVKPLRREVELKLLTAHTEIVDANAGAIRFFPDGSSTGGRITLAAAARSYVVDVDWLTGRVQIHE
jgi:general secretion pathway protein H